MKIKFIQNLIDKFRHKIYSLKYLVDMSVCSDKIKNSKTLILGSSHFAYGYIPVENEFNLAGISQDLYTSYNLYKKFNNENLKNIIISFSVFTPGNSLIKTCNRNICVLYKILFDIDYQYEDDAKINGLYKLEKYYKKEIERYKRKINIPENYYGGISKYEIADVNFAEDAMSKVQKHYKNNQRTVNEMNYCLKLLDETKKYNQNIYFVITPHTLEYRSNLPEKDELFKCLYEACKGKEHCKILNYFDNPEFNHSDFLDSDHLNKQGAEKLTNMIRREIENGK